MDLHSLSTHFLWLLFTILCAAHINRYLTKMMYYWERRGVKGPRPIPFLGNILDLIYSPLNELQLKCCEKYGNVYGHMILSQPVLTVADPELIREIAIKHFTIFNGRLNFFAGDPFLSQALPLIPDGNDWKRVRNIVSPTFSSGKIRRMFPLVNERVDNILEHVGNIATENREVELKKLMTAYTMDVTVKCVFAMDTNSYENPNGEFLCNAYEFLRFRLWRVLFAAIIPQKIQKRLNVQLVPEYIIEYFTKIITYIIDERKRCEKPFNDFIKLLIDAEYNEKSSESETKSEKVCERKKLDTSEIIGQSIAIFTGGYETSAALLNFCVYELSLNERVQEKLYEELCQHFPEDVDDYDLLNRLTYLDAVINESLRHYSPVTSFDRLSTQDCLLGDSIFIEKGTLVTLAYYAIHHNPEYFPQPHLFKPERFLPENRHRIKPYTFIPFGVGPRNCVGMRFALLSDKLLIAKLVKNYKIIATKSTPNKPTFTGKMFILTAKPLFATFERRMQK